MLNIGFNNNIAKNKILAITTAESAPLIRKRKNAEDLDKLIDCSKGRPVRSLIHLENGVIATSAVAIETLVERWKK